MNFPPLASRRKRASTASQDLRVPPPEALPSHYTPDRVQKGIDYATARLSRNPTPNTEKLLTLYKAACVAALDDLVNTAQATKENLDEIRGYEMTMSNKLWIAEVPSFQQEELVKNLLQLRRFTFWVRYGDYAQVLSHMLRSTAADNKVEYWKDISGQYNWTQISKAIRDEQGIWDKYGSGKPQQVQTTLAVYNACQHSRMEHDNMIEIIHLYAERNTAFHRGLSETIEKHKYNQIADWLERDLRDLPSIVPVGWIEQEVIMKASLEALRSEWFDTTSEPDEPLSWTWKPALASYGESLKKDQNKAEKENQLAIAKIAAELLAIVDEEAEPLAQAFLLPNKEMFPPEVPDTTAKGKAKRKASQPIDVSDRKKAFATICEQHESAHDERKKSISHVRELNRTLLAYRDEYGSESPS